MRLAVIIFAIRVPVCIAVILGCGTFFVYSDRNLHPTTPLDGRDLLPWRDLGISSHGITVNLVKLVRCHAASCTSSYTETLRRPSEPVNASARVSLGIPAAF